MISFTPNPSILGHQTIPKPLHGVNPRNIFGGKWWEVVRKMAYAKNGYRCESCGVHKSEAEFFNHLEAHEFYEMDLKHGRVYFDHVVALCHSCHMFIHSGRMFNLVQKGEFSRSMAHRIVTSRLEICKDNDVVPFYGLHKIVDLLDISWDGGYHMPEDSDVPWGDWRLVIGTNEFEPVFKDIHHWCDHYGMELSEDDEKWLNM